MDWKTILTSGVIAAIISGVFAIIQQKIQLQQDM